jgi:DNA invertase Pin-like site-specific DNA recombinase
MPFGGHQQIMRGKFLSKLPYYHLLPMGIYKSILKLGKENVQEMVEIKETGISIERFEKIVNQTGYNIISKTHYLINPIYEYKFGWKPKIQNSWMSKIKYIRNYFTTCVYYLITPNK